jgi:hypothetical protein
MPLCDLPHTVGTQTPVVCGFGPWSGWGQIPHGAPARRQAPGNPPSWRFIPSNPYSRDCCTAEWAGGKRTACPPPFARERAGRGRENPGASFQVMRIFHSLGNLQSNRIKSVKKPGAGSMAFVQWRRSILACPSRNAGWGRQGTTEKPAPTFR